MPAIKETAPGPGRALRFARAQERILALLKANGPLTLERLVLDQDRALVVRAIQRLQQDRRICRANGNAYQVIPPNGITQSTAYGRNRPRKPTRDPK